MLPNKLTYFLIFIVSVVVGFTFMVTPAIAVNGVLSVPDADSSTTGIQVYGVEGQSVTFELTITYDALVIGFDANDIELRATWDNNGSDAIITNGATAGPVTPAGRDSEVFTSEITVNSDVAREVEKVWIEVPSGAASTPGTVDSNGNDVSGTLTNSLTQIVVEIIRRPPPPEIIVSGDTTISGDGPFTVTLTATTAITLTETDIEVTGGLIDDLSSDAANEVWTVTITPGVGKTEIIVEPAANSTYTFPRHTVTVDPTVTDTAIPLTMSEGTAISADPSFTIILRSAAGTPITLTSADIKVTGGSVQTLTSDAAKEIWTVTIVRFANRTQVTVEPADPTKYSFPSRTFTVDSTGPMATITGTPPPAAGSFAITISFDEPLQTGATLAANEIKVTGGTLRRAHREHWHERLHRYDHAKSRCYNRNSSG